jgi:hypothetical protein
MPYVTCSGCGTSSYAARPHALAAECPVCGTGLVDPRLVARPLLRPSLPTSAGAGRAPRTPATVGKRVAGQPTTTVLY